MRATRPAVQSFFVALVAGVACGEARGVTQLTTWEVPGATSVNGTLGTTAISLTDLTGSVGLLGSVLTGPGFAYAPAPTGSTPTIEYTIQADWTATFSPAVSDLLVYAAFWRPFNPIFVSSGTTSYEFSQPFTVAPGSTGANFVHGNGATPQANDTLTLTGGAGDFFAGILIFSGPISSLSVNSSETTAGAGQSVTFGLVPEPAGAGLGLLAGAAGLKRRRRI